MVLYHLDMTKNNNNSNLNPQDIQRIATNEALLIDVRSAKEYSFEHAANSMNIPFDELENRSDELLSLDRPVFVCCGSGMRSSQAVKKLKSKGLVQVYNAGSWQKFVR